MLHEYELNNYTENKPVHFDTGNTLYDATT